MSPHWDDPTRKPLEPVATGPTPQVTVAVVGARGTRSYTLRPGRYTIGRGEDSDLQVEDSLASRRHALLEVGATVSLSDLGSANGTRLNRVPLLPHAPAELKIGGLAEVGTTVFFVTHAPADEGLGAVPPFLATVDRVAGSHLNVLLLGESGVGKEVMADRIHRHSTRADRAFVKVNCAALVDSLMEAELFGYERGAFTGAHKAKPGLLEQADGGTFFLDEVGELPTVTQAKLLRVLETCENQRVGGLAPTRIDVRFVAATNRDLPALIRAGQFREDLFFRLEGYVVQIPPLRERREEILALAERFTKETCEKLGRTPLPLAPDARLRLLRHAWPGNVRELRNVIARSVVLCTEPELAAAALQLSDPPPTSSVPASPEAPARRGPGRAQDREEVLAALNAEGGNQKRAAARLGVSVRTLQTRLDQMGIPRPRK